MVSIEFKILIDRKISKPEQRCGFEYGSEYRSYLQNAMNRLGWKAILTTLGGGRLIGAYASFNATIASNSGSLINIVYNLHCNVSGSY